MGGLFWLLGSSLCGLSHLFGALEVELMAENYLSECCALSFQTQPFSPQKLRSNLRKGWLKSFLCYFCAYHCSQHVSGMKATIEI